MVTENLKMGVSWQNFAVLTVCQATGHGGSRHSVTVNFDFACMRTGARGSKQSFLSFDRDLFDIVGSILSFYKKL